MPSGSALTNTVRRLLLICFSASSLTGAECRFAGEIDRAERLLKDGQFRDGIAILERVERQAPACDPDQYRLLAAAWLNLNSNGAALAAAQRGIRAFPAFEPLQEYYVSVVSRVDSKTQAIPHLQTALAVSPRSGVYRKALARTLLDLDPESERAGALLAEAVRIRPADVEARCWYAEWLCTFHREAEAAAQIERALAISKGDTEAQVDIYRLKAATEDLLDRPDTAEAAFRTAIDFNGRRSRPTPFAEWDYAQFLLRRSREADARAVLQALLRREPSFGPAHFALAKILARASDYDHAIEEAAVALTYAPAVVEQKPIHAFLSRTCHAAGRDVEARSHEQWVEAH